MKVELCQEVDVHDARLDLRNAKQTRLYDLPRCTLKDTRSGSLLQLNKD